MSLIDKAVMLEALGWSRGGKKDKHLPDDIVRIIHQFTYFDIRSDAYKEYLLKEDIKSLKLHILDYMLYEINKNDMRRCETGKYRVEYNPINIGSNCCTMCGDFVPKRDTDPIPKNIKCCCKFISEEEIMELEHGRYDNYFWEEELNNKQENERIQKNREYFKDETDWYKLTPNVLDDDYGDMMIY